MASYDLYTDSTVQSAGALTGGATVHAVLGDASTASYVTLAAGSQVKVTVAAPTSPAGSRLKYVSAVAGLSSISVNTTKFDLWLERAGVVLSSIIGQVISTTTNQVFGTPGVYLGDLSDAQVGADLVVGIRRSTTGAVTNMRAYDAIIRAVYAEKPTTTVTTSVSGDTVSVDWVHTAGTDGGPQRWYRAMLFDAGSGLVFDSGFVDSPSTNTLSWSGLPAGVYTWSVRTAQDVGGTAHWADADTDTETVLPGTRAEVLTVTPTPDPLQAVVEVELARDTGEDAWTEAPTARLVLDGATFSDDIEAGTGGIADGWAAVDFDTVSGTSQSIQAGGESGNFQRFTATVGVFSYRNFVTTTSIPVTAGGTVVATCRIKSSGASGTAVPRLTIAFDSAETATNADWNSMDGGYHNEYPPDTTSWKSEWVAATVPTGARSALLGVVIEGGASGGALTIDYDLVDAWVSTEDWVDLRVPATLATDTGIAYDYDAPNSVPLMYRARALNAGGATGQWTYSDPVEWDVDGDGVWWKPEGRPDLNMQLCLTGRGPIRRPRPHVIIPILGSDTYVTRTDGLKGIGWRIPVETETSADALQFLNMHKASSNVLLQFPAEYDMNPPHLWVSVVDVEEDYLSPVLGVDARVWAVDVVEIERPT